VRRPVLPLFAGSPRFATVRQAPIWGTANRTSTLWAFGPGKANETLAASNSHVGTGALARPAERSSAVLRSGSL
jgi:hypothetical protein